MFNFISFLHKNIQIVNLIVIPVTLLVNQAIRLMLSHQCINFYESRSLCLSACKNGLDECKNKFIHVLQWKVESFKYQDYYNNLGNIFIFSLWIQSSAQIKQNADTYRLNKRNQERPEKGDLC